MILAGSQGCTLGLYLLAILDLTAAMRVHPASGSLVAGGNAAPGPGSQTTNGEWRVVNAGRQGLLVSLLCLSHSASAGRKARQGKARQGKTRQGFPFGSVGAHHWPMATGCRISRGWLPADRGQWIGEAPGGVGSCRDDWKSLREELGGHLPSCLVSSRLSSHLGELGLSAPPPPPMTQKDPVLAPREVKGCVKR